MRPDGPLGATPRAGRDHGGRRRRGRCPPGCSRRPRRFGGPPPARPAAFRIRPPRPPSRGPLPLVRSAPLRRASPRPAPSRGPRNRARRPPRRSSSRPRGTRPRPPLSPWPRPRRSGAAGARRAGAATAAGRTGSAGRRGSCFEPTRPWRYDSGGRQRSAEFAPRADVELGEDLVEVVLDGARADEELCADLGVGVAGARESGDLRLVRCERVARLDGAPRHGLTGGGQLPTGALGERPRADAVERLVRPAELLARVDPPLLAPQPLPVEQLRTGDVDEDAAALE